jgi:membrane associated rhomboid family serine protease
LALAIVNVVVFLAEPWYATRWLSVQPIQVDGLALYYVLTAYSQLIASGEWWRLVTANFLHIVPEHLAANVVGLVAIGWAGERLLGTRVLIVTYLLTGTSALAAAYTLEGCQSWMGASASVYGLVGALGGYLIAAAIRDRRYARSARNVGLLVALVVLIEILDIDPESDHLAHLWGLAAGLPIGLCSTWFGVRGRMPLVAVCLGLILLTAGLVIWRDRTFSCHI